MTCMEIGLWSVNPNVVECNLIDCGEPNLVQYATMIGENFTYNSIIHYECVKGKWFSRGVYGKTITCLVDSSWNATYTSCIDVECPHPSSVTNHATYIGEDLTYLNLITVHCNHGYIISHGVAHTTLRCMGNGSWDLPNDKFTCKPVVCPTPPTVWYSNTIGTNYSLDATVIYDCNHDYFISRSQDNITITCTDVAIWRPNPKLIKCIHKSLFLCDKPAIIPNSNILATSFAYESIVNITCLNGYWFSPHNYSVSIQCQFSGTWLPHPTGIQCLKIGCGEPEPQPQSTYEGASYDYGDVVHMKCDKPTRVWMPRHEHDMFETFMKSVAIQCNADGKWYPSPTNISCLASGCPNPDEPLLTTWDGSSLPDIIELGEFAYFSCKIGSYIKRGVSRIHVQCTESGLWYPEIKSLRCLPIKCGFKQYYKHGTYVGSNTVYGSWIKYVCDDGYYVNTTVKNSNSWTTFVEIRCTNNALWRNIEKVHECIPIPCPDPGHIPHSTRSPSTLSTWYERESTITYTCNSGYWFHRDVTVQVITCGNYGNWLSGNAQSVEQCEKVTCHTPPHLPFAKFSHARSKHYYEIDEWVVYECSTGWRFNKQPLANEQHTSTCGLGGEWSALPHDLLCEEITCPTPHHIKNSVLSWNETTAIDSNAVYTCVVGYYLRLLTEQEPEVKSYDLNVQCKLPGQWFPDTTLYACKVVVCPTPPTSIPHATKYGKVYEAGFYVNYACHYGHVAAGTSIYAGKNFIGIKCTNNGTWSIDVTKLACQKKRCTTAPQISNTILITTDTTYGSTSTYKCKSGYFINQHSSTHDTVVLTCDVNAQWTPQPDSIQCTCKLNLNSMLYNVMCFRFVKSIYYRIIICLMFTVYECDEPGSVKNAVLMSDSYKLGSNVQYQCDKGNVCRNIKSQLYTLDKIIKPRYNVFCKPQ
ncbi:sushi, von Willebrand factor type A, EGF and pentraxin domain-containing protein 1-like [Ciona intestinalis]